MHIDVGGDAVVVVLSNLEVRIQLFSRKIYDYSDIFADSAQDGVIFFFIEHYKIGNSN